MNKNSNFFSIGNLLKNNKFYSKKTKINAKFNFLELVQLWPKIVGRNLSAHTLPLKYINKKLTVITDHSVFSHQLKFLERPIILKIYKYFPRLEGQISNIIFQNDNKKFHAKIKDLNPQNTLKTSQIINDFDPKVVKLKIIGEKKFQDIKDQELRKLMINLFIQFELNDKD